MDPQGDEDDGADVNYGVVELEDGGRIFYQYDVITGELVRDADGRRIEKCRLSREQVRANVEAARRAMAEAPIHASDSTAREVVEAALEGFGPGFDVGEDGELEDAHPRRVARTLVALDAIKLAADAVRRDVMQKAGAEALGEALILIEDAKAN